jgi:hypothetical protein
MFDLTPYQPPEDFNSQEALWNRFCANRVEILLAEIRPYDAIRVLWSFTDMIRWKFKRSHGQFDGRP